MSIENKVAWFEGMFLQPQHFQQHDRYIEYLLQQHHRAVDNNMWGFTELILDEELFSLGKIGIKSCAGIFPDGTPFNIPAQGEPPIPLSIADGTQYIIVYLAIPVKQNGICEIATKEYHDPVRYHVKDIDVLDNCAGSRENTSIQVGELACRLLSEHDDLSQYTYLPIAKIQECRSDHHVVCDKAFVTSYLDAHCASGLNHFIQEVHGLLNHRAAMLAGRLTDTEQAGTAEIVDFMLLQLVNKYEPLFHYLKQKRPLHPEKLFQILIQLMGEMATFTSDKRRAVEPPIYQHDDLYHSFRPIILNLRHALSMVLEQNATAISLEARQLGVWVGKIHDKNLLNHCQFILAAYADIPGDNLRQQLPLQIKVAPVEQIRTLVSRALPGIGLNILAVAPRQIPYHANFTYFSLDKKNALWQELQRSGGIAFQVSSQFPGLKLELWAIKG